MWSSDWRISAGSIPWSTDRLGIVNLGHVDCLLAVYQGVPYPWHDIPCSYCLYVAEVSVASLNSCISHAAQLSTFLFSLARLLRDGNLPDQSLTFMLISSLLFALLGIFKLRFSSQNSPYTKWIPSGVAFAIGFLNTPSFSMARLIGGIVEYVYRRRLRQNGEGAPGSDITIILVGSGFVLGEGVISIVGLVLKSFGVPSSCIGCLEGVCSC